MSASVGSLVCGRCRRKTGEVVSKLCHACAAPLHPSCSDDVATHECGLAFGFPVPTAFCSKRCYETDLLAHNSNPNRHQQQQLAYQQQKHLPHVPNEVTAALTVKIGDVSKTSRKHVSVTTFRFLLSEGFEVFRAKANSRTTRELQQHAATATESYVRDDRAVYIRPGVHSKQAELVELTEKNFEARIARTYRNFLKRKPTSNNNNNNNCSTFECDIFTYVRKDSTRRKQLASGVKGTSRMHTFMVIADQDSAAVSAMDPSSTSGGVLVQQSSIDHGAVDVSNTNTGTRPAAGMASNSQKRKHAQFSEPTPSSSTSASTAPSLLNPPSEPIIIFQDPNQDPAYKTVRMVLNGQVVPVKVNVRDLLACFGMGHAATGDDTTTSMQDL